MMPRRVATVGCSAAVLTASLPGVVGVSVADPQVGTCTSSYTLYSERQLVKIDPGVADIFDVIDTNGNGYICFKPYPNGDHNGHGGNLVDDKSGSHL